MPEPANNNRLFTVIMDFEGITSATQFRASSVEDALRLWLDALSQPHACGLTDPQRARLLSDSNAFDRDMAPTPLQGLQSTWCSTVSPNDRGLALLNIIETVDPG